MPVFALAYLHDAMLARGEATGARITDLRRRMSNAILPEGGSAHVEELADPYLLWFWNSNVRSTAIVLNSLVNGGVNDAPMRQIVRWMMAARKDGRWGNTQENAHAMQALVAYYRKYESTVPDFRAVVSLGARELARDEFRGRSTESSTTNVPLARVIAAGPAGTDVPLTFRRDGSGTLFYAARLQYAGLARDVLRSFGLTAVALATAAAVGARITMVPSLRIVTAVAIGTGLAAAAGGALRSAGRGARMRWLAAGAGLGLLITLVR